VDMSLASGDKRQQDKLHSTANLSPVAISAATSFEKYALKFWRMAYRSV
jgi:hypothetical protein